MMELLLVGRPDTGPGPLLLFLSGSTDDELTFVRRKVEQHVSPEIAEAKRATLKAMNEAEQGWQKAMDKIAERAGLAQALGGGWRYPSAPEAA
jgi:hypothetical protein